MTSLSRTFANAAAVCICSALLLLAGCASHNPLTPTTPVPASASYCFSTSTDANFADNLKEVTATYGSRNLRWIGRNASMCNLTRFETYTVSWRTKDGRNESHQFDFENIMRKFQDETPAVQAFTRHATEPDLFVAFQSSQIKISYRLSQYPEGGMETRNGRQVLVKPAVVTEFRLLTVPLSSSKNAVEAR